MFISLAVMGLGYVANCCDGGSELGSGHLVLADGALRR